MQILLFVNFIPEPSCFTVWSFVQSSLTAWVMYMGFYAPVLLFTLVIFVFGSLSTAMQKLIEDVARGEERVMADLRVGFSWSYAR